MLCNSPWLCWGSVLPGGGGLRLEEWARQTPVQMPLDACLSVHRDCRVDHPHMVTLHRAECGRVWFLAWWCRALSRCRTLGATGQNLVQIGAFQLNWMVSAGEGGRRQEGAQGWRGEVEIGGEVGSLS